MNTQALKDVLRSKTVWVAALGYFVDVYDLVLFGIVRVASLKGIGVPESELTSSGAMLLNWQMTGMLAGGVVWGILADKFGRMRALYGSIFLYSAANLANGFATNLPVYSCLRFIAGFGLAGELGAAITLVSESVPRTARGIGSALIGFAGFVGAVSAATLGGLVSWNSSYIIGGLLGFALLLARVRVGESEMFVQARAKAVSTSAALSRLVTSPARLWKFARCVLVGMPIWFISGILMYFAPEFGRELGIQTPVLAGQAILWNYMGAIFGDPAVGVTSQWLGSRKKGILVYLALGTFLIPAFFFLLKGANAESFYLVCFLLGIANSYWTLFVTMTSEHFGTDVRATVTTSAPNFVRGMVVPMSTLFIFLKTDWGTTGAALSIGMAVVAMAILALVSLPETFHKDLDYVD